VTTRNKKRPDSTLSVNIAAPTPRKTLEDEDCRLFVNFKRLEPKKWVKVKEWKCESCGKNDARGVLTVQGRIPYHLA